MARKQHKTSARVTAYHHRRPVNRRIRDRHFLQAYWPYVPVFAVLVLGLVFNAAINRQHHTAQGYATNIHPQTLLAETNGDRSTHNKPALQLSAQLTRAAQAKANDMAVHNYWSHTTPTGAEPWMFIQKTGYHFEAAGENLAYGFGTSDQVIAAWMASPEHRANLLNGAYQDVGFATANTQNYQGHGPETIVVAMYGEPVGMISADDNGQPHDFGDATAQVSRLELISTTPWVSTTVAVIAAAGLALFFIRHMFAWHRVLVKSEEFLVRHPFLDVFLLSASVLAFLLSHAAGTIL